MVASGFSHQGSDPGTGPEIGRLIQRYVEAARTAPRLTTCFDDFGELVRGDQGVPRHHVALDAKLLHHDRPAMEFAAVREAYSGHFSRHFVASVPFVLEEQCRMGAALLGYGRCLRDSTSGSVSVYTLGDGPGVMARALSTASAGDIATLNCSPNPDSRDQFLGQPADNSFFFLGPFFDLTGERRAAVGNGIFRSGFDVLIEDTTFQMYGRDRLAPIALATRHLKPGGILILHEKLMQPDPDDFRQREAQKDESFKARYFQAGDRKSVV